MLYPRNEELIEKADSKYSLVIMSARRARQVNEYLNALNKPGILKYRPPAIDSLSSKPLTIALEEIAAGKVTYKRLVESIK